MRWRPGCLQRLPPGRTQASGGGRVDALGSLAPEFAGALFADKEIYETWTAKIPLRRHAEPNEMAGTVLYLVSDASSYTNGECIVVDGGLTI